MKPAPNEQSTMSKKKPLPLPEPAVLTIGHLGRSGDGVAVHHNENIFVPYALPEEEVAVEIIRRHKMPPLGKLKNVVRSAATRAAPVCQHFGVCGGCALQHMTAEAYAAYKVGLLQHELTRAGIVPESWGAIKISPPASRRRVVYSARMFKDGQLSVGFNERGAHWLVDVQHCAVVRPEVSALLPPLRALLRQLLQPSDKVDIAVTWFPEGLDVLLLGLPRLDLNGREALASFARAEKLARLSVRARKIKDREPIYQVTVPSCQFGALNVRPPAGAFLQATTAGEAAMVAEVQAAIAAYAPQAKDLADLFAGSGTFSGVLADYGRVLAVEFAGESLTSLQQAAAAQPNLRISTRAQDLFADPLTVPELNVFDVVLFDPPRAGAAAQAAMLANSKVPLVIGISCNPETFARDAKALLAGGYHLKQVTPVDQFLWSPHLEVVGVFTRAA